MSYRDLGGVQNARFKVRHRNENVLILQYAMAARKRQTETEDIVSDYDCVHSFNTYVRCARVRDRIECVQRNVGQ